MLFQSPLEIYRNANQNFWLNEKLPKYQGVKEWDLAIVKSK